MTIAKFGAPSVKRTDGQESCAEADRAQAAFGYSASHGGAVADDRFGPKAAVAPSGICDRDVT